MIIPSSRFSGFLPNPKRVPAEPASVAAERKPEIPGFESSIRPGGIDFNGMSGIANSFLASTKLARAYACNDHSNKPSNGSGGSFSLQRSGGRFLVRGSRFWRRQPRLLRAWPRSASVARHRHLTSAQPSTPMTLTPVETIRQATKQTPPLTPPTASDTPHPLFLQKSCNQHSAHTVRNAPARSVIAPAWPLPADAKSSAPAASKAASA